MSTLVAAVGSIFMLNFFNKMPSQSDFQKHGKVNMTSIFITNGMIENISRESFRWWKCDAWREFDIHVNFEEPKQLLLEAKCQSASTVGFQAWAMEIVSVLLSSMRSTDTPRRTSSAGLASAADSCLCSSCDSRAQKHLFSPTQKAVTDGELVSGDMN